MVQFHLGENSISFSDDFDKLNALRGVIADGMSEFSIYDTMAQLFSTQIFRMLALFMKVMIAQPSRCLLSIIVL